MSTSLERLSALLVQNYGLSEELLSPDTELAALGIDSLGTVELLWSVEECFAIRVPASIARPCTLGDVVRCIDKLAKVQRVTLDTQAAQLGL